ncbi:MAG: 16S rRNA (cytidine(1402)-2'-O)-methyltransferase [Nitrosomonadales bacterium]
MAGILFIVSTPIGNLKDITYRAIETLKAVDLIACEDTRHTKKLLHHYQIEKKTESIHQHNESAKSEKIIEIIKNGSNVAYLSDAGTPGISDPGSILVTLCHKNKIQVSPIPGVSAVTSSVSVSGFNESSFAFFSFLPPKRKQLHLKLNEIKNKNIMAVIFESPKRVLELLNAIEEVFGSAHKVFIARELTKMYESLYFEDIKNHIKYFQAHHEELKGEFVVIIEKYMSLGNEISADANKFLGELILYLPLSKAVKIVAEIFNCNKDELYKQGLDLKKNV